jgi:signal transduction histidine kinase
MPVGSTRRRSLTLFARVTLILVGGLLAAQVATLMLHLHDRALLPGVGVGATAILGSAGLPARFFLHLGLTLTVVIGVSLIAVRWVTNPLQDMANAATRFADDLDAAPLDVNGPPEVRRAAEAFNFMQQRLRRLVVERGRALAAVSHDLRTPLTRMRLRAELIDDPVLQGKLNADIDAMQTMVDGVLAYLRGLEDAEPVQNIDILALLQSIVEDERELGRPVSMTDAAPVSYRGKLTVLRRAITNLVANAAAHARNVTLSMRDEARQLTICVEDDGPGIPGADLQRVTEPFVRLDAARSLNGGGMGLGLAIVRDAVAYHGGRLVLENRAEGGLRAMLVLPVREG